jgi:molybdopterin-containing oxidoreductase family membrane subunit
MEFFIAWYSGSRYERFAFVNRMMGPYWWAYWSMIFCNVVSPQVFWFRKARTNLWITMAVALFVDAGMWFERFVIIAGSLERDFLPSSWTSYVPTLVELGTLAGSFGLFFTLFLLFCRFPPMISMFEVKTVLAPAAHAESEERP